MHPTKMAEKQRFLARTASEHPDHRFTNLYDLLHWDCWMHISAERVLARPGSQTDGVDGQTRIAFKADYERQMTVLIDQLKRRTYKPQPVRRVYRGSVVPLLGSRNPGAPGFHRTSGPCRQAHPGAYHLRPRPVRQPPAPRLPAPPWLPVSSPTDLLERPTPPATHLHACLCRTAGLFTPLAVLASVLGGCPATPP